MDEKWQSSIDKARRADEMIEKERLRNLRLISKREDLRFELSSTRGLMVAPVIRRHIGFDNRILSLDIFHVPPGGHGEAQRNPEALMHVLNGHGYSIINDERVEWERGDTLHIKPGYWNQHFNISDEEPANFLWATNEPLINYVQPMPVVPKGDTYSDPPEDYVPPHPFGYEQKPIEMVGGEKWMSIVELRRRERVAGQEQHIRDARTIMRGRDVQLERSVHKGDFIVGIADQGHGFANQVVRMHLQQLPPESHTETHKHDEAIIYVLQGKGYSLMDGVRYEWQEGDTIFVPTAVWHQHWNPQKDSTTQHIAITQIPLQEFLAEHNVLEVRHDGDFTEPPSDYVPLFPWDLRK
ncbi:MAG: cupin domain-containing protein [Firmicutes bacterium]|nr:cupin domain-containing protein [Bacillota bacterium]